MAELDIISLGGKDGRGLVDHLDTLEKALSVALCAYRSTADEALMEHMDALERSQAAHELEVSRLKAENAMLREKLGLLGQPQHPVLFQEQMADAPADARRGDRGNIERARSAVHNKNEDADEDPIDFKRNRKQAPPAGTWQNFIAWVPNGAALQAPVPWQPISAQDIANANSLQSQTTTALVRNTTANNTQSRLRMQKTTAMESDSVLPGGVPKHDRDSVDEDNSDGASDKGGTQRFELYEMWKPSLRDKNLSGALSSNNDSDMESTYSAHNDDDEYSRRNRSRFILNPDSNTRICWDLLSLCMVIYDMIFVPMMSFDMPLDDPFLVGMEWLTRCFWTLDMCWSACTGFVYDDGSVEYRWNLIMKKYLKTWFSLDLFIVLSDWATLFFSTGGLVFSRAARISRTVRVVRLLRLVRMQEIMANLLERVQSDQMTVTIHVCKRLIFMMFSAHVLACLWFLTSDFFSARDSSWVYVNKYNEAGVGTQYLVSLYWAISQFTGGMEEIKPAGAVERLYAILVIVFSFTAILVMGSTFTSTLTHHFIIGGTGARQIQTLKLYLKQNHIPKNLTKRVCRNAKHALSGDLTQERVDLLGVISEPLKREINFEMYSRILGWHPFFRDCLHDAPQMMQRVCQVSCSMLLLAEKDVVFHAGEEPTEPKMYIVVAGVLEYHDVQGDITPVGAKTWLAEPCLWTQWQHQGTLTAINNVKLATLDSLIFQDVCRRYMKKPMTNGFNPKMYANEYMKQLNQYAILTDLPERY